MTNEEKTQKLYDRIADVHNVALRVNGYRQSVTRYLRSLNLDLGPNPLVLDAESGTGVQTLGLASAGLQLNRIVALDLSAKSLKVARQQFQKDKKVGPTSVNVVQGDMLRYPFNDNTFDLVLSCGAMEYVPLENGLAEIARILKVGGKLIFIPVKPSVVGSVLEVIYRFKTHRLEEVEQTALRYFSILGTHSFPALEPMGWSKSVFLLEKRGD